MKNGETEQQGRALQTSLNIIDDSFMEGWTMKRVKTDAKRLLATKQKLLADEPKAGTLNRDLRRALLDVIHDIEVAETRLNDAFSQMDEKVKLEAAQAAMERAFQAGLKFMAVKSRDEYPKSDGKAEHPAWPFIREVWKQHPDRRRKEIISKGVENYRAATQDTSKIDEGKFIPHFKEMVVG